MDNLLDYEADPMICDQDGLNAIEHVANHEMRQMLLNYVEQSTRGQKKLLSNTDTNYLTQITLLKLLSSF